MLYSIKIVNVQPNLVLVGTDLCIVTHCHVIMGTVVLIFFIINVPPHPSFSHIANLSAQFSPTFYKK